MPRGNSMQVSISIEGLDKCLSKLKIYDTQSRKRIERTISKAGRNIRDGAKSRVPVRTGKLRDSIVANFSGAKMTSTVKAKASHAPFIEFGADPAVIKPKNKKVLKIGGLYVSRDAKIPARKAQPFLHPAFQAEKPRVEQEIKKILRTMP